MKVDLKNFKTRELIFLLILILFVIWTFRKGREKYAELEKSDRIQTQINKGELTQGDVDAVMKFIKS